MKVRSVYHKLQSSYKSWVPAGGEESFVMTVLGISFLNFIFTCGLSVCMLLGSLHMTCINGKWQCPWLSMIEAVIVQCIGLDSLSLGHSSWTVLAKQACTQRSQTYRSIWTRVLVVDLDNRDMWVSLTWG